MKRRFSLLTLPVIALLLLGSRCKPDITACFTVVPDSYRDPRQPVQFTNCSTGADSYLWEFGDGETSTEVSPAHTYDTLGTFDVRLTATRKNHQETFSIAVPVEYPKIQFVRVVQLPVINPRNGQPLDPDGSGLDLYMDLEWVTDNSGSCDGRVINATLPVEIPISYHPSINAYWWNYRLMISDPDNLIWDTIRLGTISFDTLMSAPIYSKSWDSASFEIHMKGIQ